MREKQKDVPSIPSMNDAELPSKLELYNPPKNLREIREKPGDAPIYSYKPNRIYLPEGVWGVSEIGGNPVFKSYNISFYIKIGLDRLLRDRFKSQLTKRPLDVLVLGPGEQGMEEMKGLADVFQTRTIDAVDGFSGNLDYLQRLLRDAPDLKDKTSLFHAGFDDMKILGGKRYDVIFASDIFDTTLWTRGNQVRRVEGKPEITDEEKLTVLGSWFNEAARHLREDPPGVVITWNRHTTGYKQEKFYHRAIRVFPKQIPVAIQCRDEKVFKTRGNVEYSRYQEK